MMKKVLIALDYNPSAQKVAETGYAIAKSMQAEITLLHVLADYSYYSGLNYSPIMGFNNFNYDFSQAMSRDQLVETAGEFLSKTKGYLGDEDIRILVRDGSSAEIIQDVAMETHADLIVVGTHSRSGFDKILMGSVAEKVLHKSHIPVLVVPVKDEMTE